MQGRRFIYTAKEVEKIIIAQSILWAAAILVVAVAEENNFSIWLLVLLAAVSITYLSRQRF